MTPEEPIEHDDEQAWIGVSPAVAAGLEARLGLTSAPNSCLKWELDVHVPLHRLADLNAFYELPSTTGEERQALMAALLSHFDAYHDLKAEDTLVRDAAWKTTARLLCRDSALLRPVIDYWACWGASDADEGFHVSPQVRKAVYRPTSFFIQACNPRAPGQFDPEDSKLNEAMQTVFKLWTEDAIMNWNGFSIRLNYKYDLSVMMLDVIMMCEAILESPEQGESKTMFPSSSFLATWEMRWQVGWLGIHADFHEVSGSFEAALNAKPDCELPLMEFLAEWKAPCERVLTVLSAAGYTVEQIPEMARLQSVLDRIPLRGMLYQQ